jgi:hypothetical protein
VAFNDTPGVVSSCSLGDKIREGVVAGSGEMASKEESELLRNEAI